MTTSAVLPRIGGMHTLSPTLSLDGRYLSFANYYAFEQPDPIAAQRSTLDVYRLDLLTGQIRQVTTPHADGFVSAMAPVASADGNQVAYIDWQKTAGIGYNGITIRDLVTGQSVRLAGTQADPARYYDSLSMSADGHYVAYATRPSYGDSDATFMVEDTHTGNIVYQAAHQDGGQLSGDGHTILVMGPDARLVDVASGTSRTVFEPTSFDQATDPARYGYYGDTVSMSTDARYVTYATGVKGADGASDSAIVRKDMITGEVKVVFEQPTFTWTYNHAAQLSPDGRFVMYQAQAETDGMFGDIGTYIKDMDSGSVSRIGAASFESAIGNGIVAFVTESTAPGHGATNVAIDAATFAGGAAAVNLSGTPHADALIGKDGNDSLSGKDGNDLLFGGLGNDTLDGGAGIDQASFLGNRADYTLAHNGTGWAVQGSAAGEGTDTLAGIERLHFADSNVALDVNGIAGQAYRVYQAAFDRTPDAGGLGYWIARMDQGMSLHDVAASFVASDEFAADYGAAPGNRAVVEGFYENVLHRAGDASGIAFWTSTLDSGSSSLADVLAGFSESPENQAALIGVMADGVAYTPYFG